MTRINQSPPGVVKKSRVAAGRGGIYYLATFLFPFGVGFTVVRTTGRRACHSSPSLSLTLPTKVSSDTLMKQNRTCVKYMELKGLWRGGGICYDSNESGYTTIMVCKLLQWRSSTPPTTKPPNPRIADGFSGVKFRERNFILCNDPANFLGLLLLLSIRFLNVFNVRFVLRTFKFNYYFTRNFVSGILNTRFIHRDYTAYSSF